jgi:hypothetical protein
MSATLTDAKPAKNEFRCYRCRKIQQRRDGDGVNWNYMQVHRCRFCGKVTKEQPERSGERR